MKLKPVEGTYDNVKQKKLHDEQVKKSETRERKKEIIVNYTAIVQN